MLPGNGDVPLHQLLAELPDHTARSVEVRNAVIPPEQHARRVDEAAQRSLSAFSLAGNG
jgi:hypothetical protein